MYYGLMDSALLYMKIAYLSNYRGATLLYKYVRLFS